MHRTISGLQEVELSQSPWGALKRRPRGAKGLGMRFQRTVEKALPTALHGQWLKFRDNNGLGYAQPDSLFVVAGRLCLVECKLTDTEEADSQMAGLYEPLLSKLWLGPIHKVVVVKYLSPFTARARVCAGWDEALVHPSPVLHAFSKRELAPPQTPISPVVFHRSCFNWLEEFSLAPS